MELKLILILFLSASLAGCGGVYHYTKTTSDGLCEVSVYSSRSVESGTINIDENCRLTTNADNIGSKSAFESISSLVKLIPVPK